MRASQASPATHVPRWVQGAVVAAAVALLWHSLGDHGLFPPDEGRYAAVGGWMADRGGWLSPELRGQLHVTKPPLAYWSQAASMIAFGKTEFAARFPSAVASTLLVVSVFAFARAAFGALVATLAVGVLASMPLFEVVGRLAITDPMLSLWWWLATCSAWMALRDGARRPGWVAAFWAATALVGLTKGPLLLAPPVIVAAWLALAGRIGDLRRLRPVAGLAAAALPLALVAWGYWSANPGRAAAIWRFEFVDRFTGGGHDDPWWTIPAAFAAGLFPATAMLTLPWFNLPWRVAAASVRAGDLRALLVVAVVLPLVGFSLLRGASPTYVLPLAAPLAVLVAAMLARWASGGEGDVPAGTRLPDVRWTCAAAMTAVGIGLPVAAAVVASRGKAPAWAPGPELVRLALPVVPAMLASWVTVACWGYPRLRLPALGIAFAATVALWLGFHRAEDAAMRAMPTRAIAAAIGPGRPVAAWGVKDPGIDWCLGRWVDAPATDEALLAWTEANPGGVVVVDERDLAAMRSAGKPVAARLVPDVTMDAWPMRRIHVCEVVR